MGGVSQGVPVTNRAIAARLHIFTPYFNGSNVANIQDKKIENY